MKKIMYGAMMLLALGMVFADSSLRSERDSPVKLSLYSAESGSEGTVSFVVNNIQVSAELTETYRDWYSTFRVEYTIKDTNCYLADGSVRNNSVNRYLPCKRLPVIKGESTAYGYRVDSDTYLLSNVAQYPVGYVQVMDLRG